MEPKSAKGRQTRLRILQAAAYLMRRQGVAGTSVDDILAASKTGKSQFYHYFGSKEQIVREVIKYHAEEGSAAVRDQDLSQLRSFKQFETWLEGLIESFNEGHLSEGCALGNLAGELPAGDHHSQVRSELESVFNKWEDGLVESFRTMRAEGSLKSNVDPYELASFVMAAIEGALLLAKTQGQAKPLVNAVKQLLEHVRNLCLGATRAGATAKPSKIPKRPARRSSVGRGFCP